MAAQVENRSPEISGLVAANSGFALIETAFVPAPLMIRRAVLWFVTIVSLGALATAAGVTMAGDPAKMAAVGELPAAAEAMPSVPAQPAAERTGSEKKSSLLPVVLRGQPSIAGRRS
jgi:hypothetical protein